MVNPYSTPSSSSSSSATSSSSSSTPVSPTSLWPLSTPSPSSSSPSQSSLSSSSHTKIQQASPQISKHHHHHHSNNLSGSWIDWIYVKFLRHVKWLLGLLVSIALIRSIRYNPTTTTTTSKTTVTTTTKWTTTNNNDGNISNNQYYIRSSSPSSSIYSFPDGPPEMVSNDVDGGYVVDDVDIDGVDGDSTDPDWNMSPSDEEDHSSNDEHDQTNGSEDEQQQQQQQPPQQEPQMNNNNNNTSHHHHHPPSNEEGGSSKLKSQSKLSVPSIFKDLSPLLRSYQPYFSPVLEDYWTSSNNNNVNNVDEFLKLLLQDNSDGIVVPIHLIVDVTTQNNVLDTAASMGGSSSSSSGAAAAAVTANPSSKAMLEGIERSKYLQLTAVTFIQPDDGVGTIQVHPRRKHRSSDSRNRDDGDNNKDKPNIRSGSAGGRSSNKTDSIGDKSLLATLPLVYLVDFGSMDRDCHRLELVLEQIQQQTRRSVATTAGSSTEEEGSDDDNDEPFVLLMDFTGSTRQTKCDFLIQEKPISSSLPSSPRVRLVKRSIVEDRYFNFTSGEIHTGQIVSNSWDPSISAMASMAGTELKPVLHSPFVLRESFVTSVRNVTQGVKDMFSNKGRTTDVGMFWKRGDYSHYGFYRKQTAEVVKKLHGSKVNSDGPPLENQVGVAYSDEKGMEAGNVQYEYAVQLVSCKIVVVAQRDVYEDHRRLMESLASGAMVLTDTMLAMPMGLVDRVNIVVYNDLEDLKNLIRYYLRHDDERKKIARKGYELAMGRHRCWHRLEELLFGKPLTHVDRPFDLAPPKKIRPPVKWLERKYESTNAIVSV